MAVSQVNFKSSKAIYLRYYKFIELKDSGSILELKMSLKDSEKGTGKKLQIRSLLISLKVSLLLNIFTGNTTSLVPSSIKR